MGWADAYIVELKRSGIAYFRPKGNSMTPRIKSGQHCTVVSMAGSYEVGDVVLCSVGRAQYLHLIKAVRGDRVQIGNNHGKINGWTSVYNVYGKLVSVQD